MYLSTWSRQQALAPCFIGRHKFTSPSSTPSVSSTHISQMMIIFYCCWSESTVSKLTLVWYGPARVGEEKGRRQVPIAMFQYKTAFWHMQKLETDSMSSSLSTFLKQHHVCQHLCIRAPITPRQRTLALSSMVSMNSILRIPAGPPTQVSQIMTLYQTCWNTSCRKPIAWYVPMKVSLNEEKTALFPNTGNLHEIHIQVWITCPWHLNVHYPTSQMMTT